jgi:hypothetical protein
MTPSNQCGRAIFSKGMISVESLGGDYSVHIVDQKALKFTKEKLTRTLTMMVNFI